MKVLLLSGDFIEDYELYAPLQAMEMLGVEVHIVCPDKKVGESIQTALHILEEGRQTYSERPGHPFDITHDWDAETKNLDQYAGLIVSQTALGFPIATSLTVGPRWTFPRVPAVRQPRARCHPRLHDQEQACRCPLPRSPASLCGRRPQGPFLLSLPHVPAGR